LPKRLVHTRNVPYGVVTGMRRMPPEKRSSRAELSRYVVTARPAAASLLLSAKASPCSAAVSSAPATILKPRSHRANQCDSRSASHARSTALESKPRSPRLSTAIRVFVWLVKTCGCVAEDADDKNEPDAIAAIRQPMQLS
jgi:hypothetical protein